MAIAKKPPVKTIEATATEFVDQTAQAAQKIAEAATESVKASGAEMLKPFSDMQEKVRAGAEKGIEQIKSQYASLKGTAETATDKLEASVQAAHAGTREINAKVLELFRAQMNAGFEHMQALFGAKSVADAVKLQQDFAKHQMEALQSHSKDMAGIAQKVASSVVEPVKASLVLPFSR